MPRTTGSYTKVRPASDAHAQAWQAMRVMRRFTSQQIEMTAAIGRSNLEKYLRHLTAAGFLRIAVPRVSGRPGSFNVYQLVIDSGPKAPIAWSNGQVYDPNTDRAYGGTPKATSEGEGHE